LSGLGLGSAERPDALRERIIRFRLYFGDAPADGKTHGFGGADPGQQTDLCRRHDIELTGQRIGLWYIHGYIVLHIELVHVLFGDETNLPDILSFDIDQNGFIELSFVPGESLEKIPERRIDEFNPRCFFQQMIKDAEYPSHHKKGTDPAHQDDGGDNDQKPYARDIDPWTQETIHPVENGIDHKGRYGNGCQDNQPLEEVIQDHFIDEPAKGLNFQRHRRTYLRIKVGWKGAPGPRGQKITYPETLVPKKVSVVLYPTFEAMDVKDRILEKSGELFKTYGIKSITMDEIAARLGVSKKTIYQYYADKEELVNAVMEQHVNYSKDDCMASIDVAENAIHEEFLIQDKTQEHIRDLNPVALHDMQKFHPDAFKKFFLYKNNFMREMVEANLKRGIVEGLYRPEIRTDILAKFRVDSIFQSMNADYILGATFGLAEQQAELFVHYLMGVGSPKGHQLIHRYLQERTQKPVIPIIAPQQRKTGI
jgi:TetR/AcrR family transcriptional regulator, cholesterol catabolism regulator